MSSRERSTEIADPKGRRSVARVNASSLDRAAVAIDGLLIMMAQTDSDMDYNAIDRAFDVLISARQLNPALPLSIPIAFEVIRRTAGELPSKTWKELRGRALHEFTRVKAEALAK